MPPRRRQRRLVTLLLAWALVVAGSGVVVLRTSTGPALSVVCSSVEELCRGWAREFSRLTGERVSMVRLSSGEALTRISRRTGEFDVWHGGPSDLYEVARARRLLAPHHSPTSTHIPASYRGQDGAWHGVYRGVLGFCVNTRVLGRRGLAAPRTWDDLLDPRLEGLVSSPNPQTSGTGWTLLWTQRLRLGGEQPALDWMRRLQANVLQYTVSGMAPAGVVARGEAAVAITFTQHCITRQNAGASHLLTVVPAGATGQEVGAVAVLADTGTPALANRYVEFALSRRAQELGADSHSPQLPTRKDARHDPRLDVPRGTTILTLDPVLAGRERGALVTRFTREVRG